MCGPPAVRARKADRDFELGRAVLGHFPQPAFMPCPGCGASVAQPESDQHVCEQERYLDYQVFARRAEVESFEDDFGAYLDSPEGRFEQWDAERTR